MTNTDRGPMGAFEGYGECDTPEPVPATNQAGGVDVEAIGRALRDTPDEVFRHIADSKDVAHARARILALMVDLRTALATQPATSQEGEGFSREWCLNMAALEGNAEISAGSLDHPLRTATPTPPTLSEDLRTLIEAVLLYADPSGYGLYDGANEIAGTKGSGEWVLKGSFITTCIRLRAALAQVKAS